MEKKVVVHMKDGKIHKGLTHDFDVDRKTFHLLPGEGGGVPVEVAVDDMKALFYVRDFMGNRDFVARRAFDEAHRSSRRAVVTFNDSEEVWGLLGEEHTDLGLGFFFYPADKNDNNIRIFVVRSAIKELRLEP